MRGRPAKPEAIAEALRLLDAGATITATASSVGAAPSVVHRWREERNAGRIVVSCDGVTVNGVLRPFGDGYTPAPSNPDGDKAGLGGLQPTGEGYTISGNYDGQVLTLRSGTIRTLEGAMTEANVDQAVWEVERYVVNKWDCVAKIATGFRESREEHLEATELWQVKVWLRRKKPESRSIETLLEQLAKNGPKVPKLRRHAKRTKHRRELEISIVDPHLGMKAYPPAADREWSTEECEQMKLGLVERLLKAASPYEPFERILLVLGNDLLHSDNVFHTTTQGTGQPESESWHHIYVRAELLGIAEIDRLKQVAPVKVIVVPGNHDRQSTFTLGRVWQAYYHNDKNVEVDCSASPYKFHHYGVNLIGFEHGHSVNANRLAALMANETRLNGWSDARYCEWHLGDQHRKGSSKPSMFEEQGVSVEYLPGLTPPNEWHRLKGFNWQKRAGMAFVWDRDRGPIARLQVNIDNYTGKIMEGAA